MTLSDLPAVQPGFTAPQVSADSTLTFQLVVTNNNGISSAPDMVSILIKSAPSDNSALTVNAVKNVVEVKRVTVTETLKDSTAVAVISEATITFTSTG